MSIYEIIFRDFIIVWFWERTSRFLSVERSNAIGFLRHRGSSSCAFQPTCLCHSRQLCSFLQYEKQLFRVSSLRERKMQDKEWLLRSGLGTEIINAQLPATPHYSVRAFFLSMLLHREFFVESKTKGRHFMREIYAINMPVMWPVFNKFYKCRLHFSFY